MIILDQDSDILGLIDIQPTFMPGGELPVPDGDAILPVVNELLANRFAHAFATQDWHPPGHGSFASAHPGRRAFETIAVAYGMQTLWPDHAIQNAASSAPHPDLAQQRIELIIRKGFRPAIDSYSAFFDNDRVTATGLDGLLRARGIRRIFLAGLALDYCVAYSAADAVKLGFETYVIEDACRGIGLAVADGRTSIDVSRETLRMLGVRFVRSTELR